MKLYIFISSCNKNSIKTKELKCYLINPLPHSIFYICFSLLFSNHIFGAGIEIMEQSTKELGQALSGAPTNSEDGSMVFFNPAAMSKVNKRLLSMSGFIMAPSTTFHNNASHLSPVIGGTPLTGSNGGSPTSPAFIPNLYYVQKLTDQFAFGLGINFPFAAQTTYDTDWKGRYQAIDSMIVTLNFNPSISFKINEKISFGAGLNIQYLQTKLTNAIDFGTICLQIVGPMPCVAHNLSPQATDGNVSLKGESVGFGYNFGLLYVPTNQTQLGVSYRSRVSHNVHSNADFSVPDNAIILTQGNTFIDTHSRTSLSLPDSILFGISHRLNPSWTVSTDAVWSHWSLIKTLNTVFSSSQQNDILDLEWRDTWRYAVGINYSSDSNKWKLRTGFAYDQTPIQNSQHSSPRLPDNNRYWLTFGITYSLLKNIDVHAAYAHIFMGNSFINSKGVTNDSLAGHYSEQINFGSVQADWRF